MDAGEIAGVGYPRSRVVRFEFVMKGDLVMMSLRKQRKKNSLLGSITSRNRRVLATCVATGLGAGLANLAQADTTSTLVGLGATNQDVPANHGSNAEATLTWDSNWDQYAEWDGRGDVYQIDRNTASIIFVPAAGNIRLAINSFALDEWAGGGDTSSRWSVTGASSGIIASGDWTRFNTANDPQDLGGRELLNINAQGAVGETLTLAFDHTNTGSISYLAMDNLTFSTTVVPEPATLGWLAATGLGAFMMRRRRK